MPQAENATLYRRYEEEAAQLDEVSFIGRLATCRYYNLDQVVAQALACFKRMAASAQNA